MTIKKPTLIYPVIVEGKYDRIKLSSLFEGQFIETSGFSIFKDHEKQSFFRRLAEKSPLILLTDSDGAGMLIRNRMKALIPKDRLIHLYIPQVCGKEKRKDAPSKEGILGVEGTDTALLRALLAPYAADAAKRSHSLPLRRIELYEKGYDGTPDAKEKRRALCKRLSLPENLSTSALLDALNLLYTRKELEKIL